MSFTFLRQTFSNQKLAQRSFISIRSLSVKASAIAFAEHGTPKDVVKYVKANAELFEMSSNGQLANSIDFSQAYFI